MKFHALRQIDNGRLHRSHQAHPVVAQALVAFVCVFAWLLAGCGGTEDSPSDSGCACATTEFCCLGSCLPLGTACHPIPGGNLDGAVADLRGSGAVDAKPAVDAKSGGDCTPRPTPGGEMATVVARCLDGGTVASCADGDSYKCNQPYMCQEWLDKEGSRYYAGCVTFTPCDPDEPPHCEGSVETQCSRELNTNIMFSPAGRLFASDCHTRFGPDSTCYVENDTTRCTYTPCNPEIDVVDTCHDDDSYEACGSDGKLRFGACGGTSFCVTNELSQGKAVCIPDVAVPSSSTENGVIACDGDLQVIAAYGYEYRQACGGPDTKICRVGGVGPVCAHVDAEPCDPDTFVQTCAGPSTYTGCSPFQGFTFGSSCIAQEGFTTIELPCDETTGRCVNWQGPCVDAAYARCDDSHRYALRCAPWEFMGSQGFMPYAEICNGCVDAPNGGSVTCQ